MEISGSVLKETGVLDKSRDDVFETTEKVGVDKGELSNLSGHKGDQPLGLTATDLLGYDPLAPSHGLSETASKETNRFLDELMSDAINKVPNLSNKDDDVDDEDVIFKSVSDQNKKLVDFGFEKPLPPEPATDLTKQFLQSESYLTSDADFDKTEPLKGDSPLKSVVDKSRTPSPGPREETPSPVPPPIPKHQPVAKTESPEPYAPTQTPEPEIFKEMEAPKEIPTRDPSPPPPPRPKQPTPPREPSPLPVQQPKDKPKPSPKPVEPIAPVNPSNKISVEHIGIKDIRTKLMESLLYWRDPKKSGVVFGVTLLTLLALTIYSLITVAAYFCLFSLGGTICFRIYKSIMQAVQKTSDGHPFKDLLELDISIPEDKVNEISKNVVQYINTSLATLRSLFLVEDLIDSIKFLILSWVLTYIGACFNGLTLIIIGVILLFSLPTVYEKNKEQIDVYVKIAMDKLSIITNKMRAAVPEGKKEEKKDQ